MIGVLPEALALLQGSGARSGEIGPGEAALRAVLVYGFTLLIVRLGSKRLMGKATAFDMILAIMIGSVRSRGINASEGLFPTFAAGSVLVGLHWLFGVIAYRVDWFGTAVKGTAVKLIENGEVSEKAMRGSSISKRDLAEALRHQGIPPDPSRIALAYLERDGSVSVIPRDAGPGEVDRDA